MTGENERFRAERKALKREYGELFDRLSRLLFEADPIGINYEENIDEYEPEVGTILPRLGSCENEADVQRVVHEEFTRWFDPSSAGPPDRYERIARDIWAALRGQSALPAATSMEPVSSSPIDEARAQAAEIASRVLLGTESPLLASRQLLPLRWAAGTGDDDPDFEAFDLIVSETDALPIGDVRKYWAADALAERDSRIAAAERWAMETCRDAFVNVVRRFRQPMP